jgi:hypothetical protein
MRVLRAVSAVLAAIALQGCIASSVLLHVNPDGTGRATITTRLYTPQMRAFDAIFAGARMAPQRPPQIEEELPPLGEPALRMAFGTRVQMVSTRLDKTGDGGIRTTEIAFDDVRQLQMVFPPFFATAGQGMGGFGFSGLREPPLMTFAMRPHDDGDRVLIVKLPNPPMTPEPDAPITKFETDSREEQLIKQAVKNMSMKLFVEIEQPLLRTNAPKREGNRATILEFDMDKMVNAMDESNVRRMMSPGSFQEMLWQVGDLPGAVVPAETEIFLEYEDPAPQQAAPPPAQAPPDTDIYLAPLRKSANGTIEVGAPVNVTNHPSYDNQPFFTPDGAAILFTSARGAASGDTSLTRTDIYRYDIAAKSISRVTQTPVGEYSPTVTPDGRRISHIRTDADGTQRLASIPLTGAAGDAGILLPDVKPVGYHAWAEEHTVALFILGGNGAPATLQVADTRTGTARVVATDIGRSLQRMPGTGASRHISFVQRERSSDADVAWTPDGVLLMAKDDVLYAWARGDSGWKEVTSLSQLSLSRVTRLAVSPRGDFLALVASSSQAR